MNFLVSKSMLRDSLQLFLPLLLVIASCKESEIYPDIPSIKYKTSYYTEDNGQTYLGVVFTYRDGDGDIGLTEADTFPPFDRKADSLGNITNIYYNNIFVEYLEVKDGKMAPFIIPNTTDTFRLEARVTSLTPEGKHKAIRGDIDYQFQPPLYPGELSDSIVLRIRIFDRALHESNTIESPVLVLPPELL